MPVSAIARDDVVSVGPDASIEEIATTLRSESIGSVLVEEDGRPVGIVTDRDLVIEVLGRGIDPATVTARDVMSTDLVTVDGDTGVLELVRTMADHGVRRMPVVEDGRLAGIVTLDDIVVLLSMELQGIANVLRTGAPAYEVSATEILGG